MISIKALHLTAAACSIFGIQRLTVRRGIRRSSTWTKSP